MKKLQLNLQKIESAEVLTRDQLKNVLGGVAAPTTGDPRQCCITGSTYPPQPGDCTMCTNATSSCGDGYTLLYC